MTLREQCEQVMTRLANTMLMAHLENGAALTYDVVALQFLEAFALKQQAVGLREAHTEVARIYEAVRDRRDRLGETLLDTTLLTIAAWCEQRARELEGT